MAHRVGTLSRRQKPLQNRTPLIVYKHEVEDALEYIVETVDNADGHKTLTALGVEKGEADVSPMILLSGSSGRRQGHHLLWQRGHIFAFPKGKQRKIDDARARRSTIGSSRIRQSIIPFGRIFNIFKVLQHRLLNLLAFTIRSATSSPRARCSLSWIGVLG
jgi:hypothetical protein